MNSALIKLSKLIERTAINYQIIYKQNMTINNDYTDKSDSQFVENDEWDEISKAFNQFYETQLTQIKRHINTNR